MTQDNDAQSQRPWRIAGLDDIRTEINAIPASDAAQRASLQKQPSLESLVRDHLTAEESNVLNSSATQLIDRIAAKELTALEVIDAFLPMASYAQQATGCLSEFFPEEARRRAQELDDKQARGEPLGLLHGLPVSIKGHILMKDHRAQNGFALDEEDMHTVDDRIRQHESKLPASTLQLIRRRALLTQSAPADGILCQILRDQGAVFYCRTTMPQSVMHLDTRSNVYGQTLNPLNLALSAGGSSGGEAALVAARGSVLGVGTDIGGSVRQPCSVTGLWGLRSTTGRIPAASVCPPTIGNVLVGSMSGPMCRFYEDMSLWMRAVLGGQPWQTDPTVHRLPWRESIHLPARVKIGVLRHDGLAHPITPIRRALEDVCAKIQPHVDLIEVDAGDLHIRHWELIRELYYPDGGDFTRALATLGHESLLPLTEHILSRPQVRNRSQHETWDLTSRRDALKKEYLQWYSSQSFDFFLCPASHTTASRPGTIKYWGYTSAFNLFDLPAAVFPTGLHTDVSLDTAYEQQHGLPTDLSEWDEYARKEYEEHRDVMDGMPVGLQLVGKRYEEEELLAALGQLKRHL